MTVGRVDGYIEAECRGCTDTIHDEERVRKNKRDEYETIKGPLSVEAATLG